MDLEQIRDEFPALRQKTFLDTACLSPAPRSATEAARFIGTDPDNKALVESTTHGLAPAALAGILRSV
jgi:hypothetical protein